MRGSRARTLLVTALHDVEHGLVQLSVRREEALGICKLGPAIVDGAARGVRAEAAGCRDDRLGRAGVPSLTGLVRMEIKVGPTRSHVGRFEARAPARRRLFDAELLDQMLQTLGRMRSRNDDVGSRH